MRSKTAGWTLIERFFRPVPAILLLASCAASGAGANPSRIADLSVPVRNDDGTTTMLIGQVCRPATDAPAPVVVIAHGSPPSASARPRETLAACDDEAPSWFTARGFVVVQTLRRGYGATGGDWAEGYGSCSRPDFTDAGLETARDIAATIDAATALPYVRPDGVVVVGQSAGAWGTLAYGSLPHPKVAALIAMAPGRGGHRNGVPNQNCGPDRLAVAAGRYGATSHDGILWVNTANDSFFDPELVQTMQVAFTGSGGVLTAAHLGTYDDDGHRLFFGDGGSRLWGPVMETYLRQHKVPIGSAGDAHPAPG